MAAIEVTRLAKVSEVLVVCEDLDGGGGTEKIVAPGIQGSHDSKQLPVINVIVAFCWAKCLG